MATDAEIVEAARAIISASVRLRTLRESLDEAGKTLRNFESELDVAQVKYREARTKLMDLIESESKE